MCLTDILSSATFAPLLCGGVVTTAELIAAITVLTTANIPYTSVFSPSNGRFAKEVTLRIYISPSLPLQLIFQYEAGQIAIT